MIFSRNASLYIFMQQNSCTICTHFANTLTKLEFLEIKCVSSMLEKYFCSANKLKSVRFEHLSNIYPILLQLENASVDNYNTSCLNEVSYFSPIRIESSLRRIWRILK